MRQRRVPFLPIRPMQLHVEHVLVTFPGLVKQESVLGYEIAVQYRRLIHRLVLHRIENVIEPFKKLFSSLGDDFELDDIGDGHHRPHAG
jgi:hypothetical protein